MKIRKNGVLETVPVSEADGAVTPKHVTATTSGESTIIAPGAGNAIRLWWYHLNADSSNSAKVVAGLRFGTGGTDFFRTDLSQYGGAVAHSFKAGKSYYQGAVDAPLLVNLSAAQTVRINIDYEEVTP